MIFLLRIILIYFCMGGISLLSATSVEIFDIGQGNSFGLEHDGPHGKRVLIGDIGSSEYKHGAFYHGQATSKNPEEFLIILGEREVATSLDLEEQRGSPDREEILHRTMDVPMGDIQLSSSDEEGSPSGFKPVDFLSPKKEEHSSRAGSSDEHLGKASSPVARSHRQSVFERMIYFIWGDGEKRVVKQVDFLGTHSDIDHVHPDYLRSIFLNPLLMRIWGGSKSQDEAIKKQKVKVLAEEVEKLSGDDLEFIRSNINILKHIILGGFKDEYNKDIHPILDILMMLGTEVIFTGSYDGSGNRPKALSTKWEEGGYARAYSSFMPIGQRSPIERKIEEEILNFGNSLETQILSMNAGFAEATNPEDRTRITNPDPNVNSIVLRFKLTGGKSFLAPGDAEEPTWAFIHAIHQKYKPEEDLNTDYFLISHHGSASNGATSPFILDLFKPTTFLISTGGHDGNSHPSYETISFLKNYLEDKNLETRKHDITYFKLRSPGSSHRDYHRLTTSLPIFSTTTGGTLSFTLNPPGGTMEEQVSLGKIIVSRHKARTFETEEGEKFIAKDFVVFSSESDMQEWLRMYMDDMNSKGTRVVILKDENKHANKGGTRAGKRKSDSPVKQLIKQLTIAEVENFLKVSTSAAGSADIDLDAASTTSHLSQMLVADDVASSSSKVDYVVIREKTRTGIPPQWLVYSVNPVIEDEEKGDQEMQGIEEEREEGSGLE